jgi:enamine deaminase RidA (YjgF/YER057c/UK114 family)
MPLRAIREQVASAVDLIVHTSRLKDGSRKIVNITEIYGIEDDEILTQDIFAFEQTGIRDGKVEGALMPTGIRPTFMGQFKRAGIELPPGEFGIPSESDARPAPRRQLKARWGGGAATQGPDLEAVPVGHGRAVVAGGMIYISAIGPVDPATGQAVGGGIKDQTRRCLSNLKSTLEADGSSLDRVVWANWSLRDPTEFDTFYEEWLNWFPGIAPVGQGTMMPPPERRAGFRVSIGVIAQQG